jgi:hypothetical protein
VPGAISAAVAEMEANPSVALLYGLGEFIESDGTGAKLCEHIEPWSLERLLGTLNLILQPATLFRRDEYMAVGGLDCELHYVMDYDLWIRLGSRFPVKFLPRVLAQARVYAETKTSTGGLPRLEEMERMVRRNGGRGLPVSYRREMWLALRHALKVAGRKRQFVRAARLTVRTSPYAASAAIGKLRRLR